MPQQQTQSDSLPLQAAFATAAAVGLQVLLPRVFSVLLWYHLGFLAVSLAMLGFAAGGRIVSRRVRRTGKAGGGLNRSLLGALAGLTAPAAFVGILRLPLQTSELMDSPESGMALLALLGMIAALSVPFLFLGTLVCSALDEGRERIGQVYGATFLGGAAGALLTLTAMDYGGTPFALALVAVLPQLPRLRYVGLPALAVAAALLAEPDELLPFTSRKHFPVLSPEQVLDERDTATSHVVFYDNDQHHGIYANNSKWQGPPPPRSIAAAIDAWAITFITEREGPDDFPPYLDAHPAGLAYEGAEPGFDALVIGAGGGWDVLQALNAGAEHVTAVEINGSIVDAVQNRWADFSGRLYEDPRVEVHVAEGRHFVDNDERLYDRIVLAGVDTFAATQAGAFALSENYLYTVEALRTYLARLKPGGRLFMTRWWFDPPRQTLRLALTAAQALREEGIEDPRRRMFITRDGNAQAGNALFFMKAGDDFTGQELNSLAVAAEARGLEQLYAWASPWDPVPRPSQPTLVAALDASDPDRWIRNYPYRVDPTTDDRPFFFENGRLQTLFRSEGNWIHDRLGGQEVLVATLLALLLLAWPLLLAGRGVRAQAAGAPDAEADRSTSRAQLVPFLFLGVGFLFVEIPLMQRLSLVLGNPVYAVTVVLVSLLTWSGIGSLLASRLPTRAAPFMMVGTAITVAAVLVGGHDPLVETLSHWSLPSRVASIAIFLALPGLAMGAGFPLAVRALGHQRPLLVASAFTWNGFASVMAGPLAVLAALHVGFRVTLLFGAFCYVLAALTLLVARPNDDDEEEATGDRLLKQQADEAMDDRLWGIDRSPTPREKEDDPNALWVDPFALDESDGEDAEVGKGADGDAAPGTDKPRRSSKRADEPATDEGGRAP